jgi:hypothetical protein
MSKIRTGNLTIAVLAVLLLGAAAASAVPALQDELSFTMNALNPGVGQTQMTLVVNRVNTTDERDALEEIFKEGGMQALAQELRDMPEVGFIRAPRISSTGWRLRYAMLFRGEDGKRILRVATDRPISFVEANTRRQRTWDFNVTLIELVLDEDGTGEGTLLAGVEFAYDEENDSFSIKQVGTQPTRLNNVRPS